MTSSSCLRIDQYAHIDRSCPVRTDLHPVDDVVEIILGEGRLGGDSLRLVLDDPDVCHQLARALHDAGRRLAGHREAQAQQAQQAQRGLTDQGWSSTTAVVG